MVNGVIDTTTPPSLSVVVTTYNRAQLLPRVLEPLASDPAAHEVIVVIDGSHDGSLELVEQFSQRHPHVRAVFIDNRGDMGARAAGAEAAAGDVVLFLDDDVLAEPGLIDGHARRHRSGDVDVVVGYMPVTVSTPRRPGDFATRLYAAEYEGRCAIYERDPVSPLRELWTGNFSIRRTCCLAVGMANPAFTEHYHADRDFGIRCLEAGLRGAFDRSLKARHLHTRTLASFRRDSYSQGAARLLLAGQHSGSAVSLPPDQFERGLPEPVRPLVRFGRRPRGHAMLAAFLRFAITAAGETRLWPAQDLAARLLRRLDQQRGAVEQAMGRR